MPAPRPSACRDYVFTINNPTLSHADLEAILDRECELYVFQEERGAEGTRHYQGYCKFNRRIRITQARQYFAAHFEPRRGTPAQAWDYASKEESRVQGPWSKGAVAGDGRRGDLSQFRDAIMEGKSDQELIEEFPNEYAKYPRFVATCRRVSVESAVVALEFVPREQWQTDLVNAIQQEPDARKITWIWDAVGNRGKSYFARHYRPEKSYVIRGGKHADIRYGYGGQNLVFFDWARSMENGFPYQLLEQFKDGQFFVEKYESHMMRFNVPHVVVLANFAPDIIQLSEDRWNIIEI